MVNNSLAVLPDLQPYVTRSIIILLLASQQKSSGFNVLGNTITRGHVRSANRMILVPFSGMW